MEIPYIIDKSLNNDLIDHPSCFSKWPYFLRRVDRYFLNMKYNQKNNNIRNNEEEKAQAKRTYQKSKINIQTNKGKNDDPTQDQGPPM